jgi:hypothetical protein
MVDYKFTAEEMQEAQTQRNIALGSVLRETLASAWRFSLEAARVAFSRFERALYESSIYYPRS